MRKECSTEPNIPDYGADSQEVVVRRAEILRVAIRAKSPEEQHNENQDLWAVIIKTILSFLRNGLILRNELNLAASKCPQSHLFILIQSQSEFFNEFKKQHGEMFFTLYRAN